MAIIPVYQDLANGKLIEPKSGSVIQNAPTILVDAISDLQSFESDKSPGTDVVLMNNKNGDEFAVYEIDRNDTSTADDGDTIIVDADGGRWKQKKNINFPGIDSGDAGKISRIKSDESGWENVDRYEWKYKINTIPDLLDNRYGHNSQSFIQDNLITYNGNQYAVWVDSDSNPIVGKREYPDGEWNIYDLSGITGNPLDTPTSADLHNVYVISIDSNGYIHIIGNMHNDPLNYAKSDSAEDISSFSSASMVGTEELNVSYPRFFKLSTGELYFYYREGSSGNGDNYINKYDPSTSSWSRVVQLIDGTTDDLSFYENKIYVDSNDVIHITGMWRRTASATTNSDVTYMYSDDGGVTWKKTNGTEYTTPIRKNSADIVYETAEDVGLINQCGCCVDNDGRVHTATTIEDSSGNTQLIHIYLDNDGTWKDRYVTNFSNGAWTLGNGRIGRPALFPTNHGDTYLLYTQRFDQSVSSGVRCIDVTPENDIDDFKILDVDLQYYEPVFSTSNLKDDHIIDLFCCISAYDASNTYIYNDGSIWDHQQGFVYSINLDTIDSFKESTVLPQIEITKSLSVTNFEVTSTTPDNPIPLDVAPALGFSDYDQNKGLLFVRFDTRVSAATGTDTINIGIREYKEFPNPTETEKLSTIQVTGGFKTRFTPWIPLRLIRGKKGIAGFVQILSWVNTGTGDVWSLNMQMGYLSHQ